MLSHFIFSVGIFMIALASSSQVIVDAFTLSSTTVSSQLRSTSMIDRASTTSIIVEMVAVCNMIESPTLVKEDTPILVTSSTTIQERSNIHHADDKSSELNDDDESYEMWTLKLFDDESNTRHEATSVGVSSKMLIYSKTIHIVR